jgi:hypothetical protein
MTSATTDPSLALRQELLKRYQLSGSYSGCAISYRSSPARRTRWPASRRVSSASMVAPSNAAVRAAMTSRPIASTGLRRGTHRGYAKNRARWIVASPRPTSLVRAVFKPRCLSAPTYRLGFPFPQRPALPFPHLPSQSHIGQPPPSRCFL